MLRRTFLGVASAAGGLSGCLATTTSDGDRETESALDGCPPLNDGVRTVCPGGSTPPLAVERPADRVSGDDWSLTITVTNRSSVPYRTDPSGWSVHRYADDWTLVVPSGSTVGRIELAPEERYGWVLTCGMGRSSAGDHRVFLSLGPGIYGFAVPFIGPNRIAAFAPFRVST